MEEAATTPLIFHTKHPFKHPPKHPWPWLTGSRAAADSECREKEAGRAAGYEDVHGDADVNVAAARRDDGGGGSGEGWR